MNLFPLIVLIAVVYAQGRLSEVRCENPFLESLESQGVAIGSQTRTTKCPGEWNTYGSCCNEGDLIKLFLTEAQAINNSSAQLASIVHDIRVKLQLTKAASLEQ